MDILQNLCADVAADRDLARKGLCTGGAGVGKLS